MRTELRKGIAILLAAVLLTAGLLAVPSFAVYAAPDDGGRVPYRYSFDHLHTASFTDTGIKVVRNLELELGQPLEAAGWMATDEGISDYLYMWVPSGGSVAGTWEQVTTLQILPRPDLTAAGIEYPSGHSTAGFQFTIEPPEDLPEGYYDIYIRALDGMGIPCDLAAILNLRYGKPDEITESSRRISFPRILREGEAALFGGAAVTEEAITLPPDGGVRLGTLHLAGVEAVRVTYEVTDPDAAGKTPVLGLKSAGIYSYGKGDEGYNATHSLAFTPIHTDRTEVLLDLTACDEYGEVWLTGHLNSEIRVTGIEFIYSGYGTDRVAARIHFSEALVATHFGGNNRTDLKGFTDPVLGDVLRLEVMEETNDPFVFFNAGGLLKEHDVVLDAHEYKYMVLLYRSYADNPTDRMHLYLCSGPIRNATEECNHPVTLLRDGKWHYLLIDLTQRANWDGIINGWRFDYLGESQPGQGIDIASIQFFRTSSAAKAAAKQDPSKASPFKAGDTPVILDMCEEENEDGETLTIDPADIYEIAEPPAEIPTEPVTEVTTDPLDETDPPTPTPEDTTDVPPATVQKGCRSALCLPLAWSSLILLALVLSKRKKSIP
jgi:hypothetical protein